MKVSRLYGIVLMAAFVCLKASPSLGAIPGWNDPNCYTERDLRRETLDFNRRTLVEAYKHFGHHDPKWDAMAEELLEKLAQYLSYSSAESLYAQPDQPKPAELEKLARAAIGAGCDDALVRYALATALHDQHDLAGMRAPLRQAVDQLTAADCSYPKYRAAMALRRAMVDTDRNRVSEVMLHSKYGQMLYDTDLAVASGTDFRGIDRRVVLASIVPDLESWPVERQKDFIAALHAGNGEPWLTNVLDGIAHISAARLARGNGSANTLAEQSRRSIADELAQARKCLTEAYRLERYYPEAATYMITVTTGEPASQDEPRTWFDRAVQGQFDYRPAYTALTYALRPRSRGNYQAMHTLGLECAATERYDTHVPYMLIDILNEIQNDAGGDWEYWRHRGLIEQVRDVLTRYGDVAESDSNKAMCLSRIVGFAWQVGRYDLGRAALDKLDGKYDADAFAQTFTIPARTVSGTYAFTGPLANALKQAEESAAAGHSDQAIAAYKDLATKTPGDDQASIWLHGRAQELTWQKLFDAGQWIDLMPHDGLAGWYVVHGSFDAYNNAIIGTAKGIESAHIVCGVKFGRRWELRLKSEVLAGAGNAPIRADAEAGVCFCLASDVVFDGIFTRPNSRLVASYTNGRESGTYAWRLPQPTSFLVRLWDGHGDAYLDDRVFLTYRALGPLSERPDNRIALGSSGAAVAATKFKFSDIQIRKLTAEPPHAPSQP